MTIGVTPDNVGWLILLSLAAIPLFLLVVGLGAIIRRLFRIQNGFFAFAFGLVIGGGSLLGASLYLDLAGQVVPAKVLNKDEQVTYRAEGDWRHPLRVTISYVASEQPTATASFTVDGPTFDALYEGGDTLVRILPVQPWLSLVRLANQSTRTWLPWPWIGGGLAVVVALVGLWRWANRTKLGCLSLLLFLFALTTLPFILKFLEWQQSRVLQQAPLRATVTVQAVHHVIWLDPLPSHSSHGDGWDTSIDVPQPYDIVTVRYTPQGHDQSLLGVDVVDATQSTIGEGMELSAAYTQDNPRRIFLLGVNRSHYWKNPLAWVGIQVGFLVAIGLGIWGLGWVEQQWNR